MKSFSGRCQRPKYFINGLSEAFKDHEKEKRKEQAKAEALGASKSKKNSQYNVDIEIIEHDKNTENN